MLKKKPVFILEIADICPGTRFGFIHGNVEVKYAQ